MDFEAILGQIMELAGPLIQMCIQICTQIVQAISSALGEGGGALKAGAAATLIGGAALTTGALQPGQTAGIPGAPVTTAQASPAAPAAPATTTLPATIQPAAGTTTLTNTFGLPNQAGPTTAVANLAGN